MTIEQEIQTAVKAALAAWIAAADEEAATDEVPLSALIHLHAVKLDNDETAEDDAEGYPAIVIDTSTPVPAGHKSAIAEVPLYIRVLTYLPTDRKRALFSELNELVFRAIHETTDWEDYQSASPVVAINAIMIESSEEPGVSGMYMEQRTTCTVAACIEPTA